MRVRFVRIKNDFVPEGMYEFTKNVTLEKQEKYRINIYTSERYLLKINGKYICEGPCKGHEHVKYYDTVETDELKAGENEIKIIVMHITMKRCLSTVFKTNQPEINFEAKSPTNTIVSDSGWTCVKNNQIGIRCAEWKSIAPVEDIDLSKDFEPIEIEEHGGYDYEFGLETYPCGTLRDPTLTPRPIPMIFPQKAMELKVIKSGEDFVELDAGMNMTAKVSFDFADKVSAKIIYAECYITENGKFMRDGADEGDIKGFWDTVETDRAYVYEPFWFRTFRYIRIESENIAAVLKSVKAMRWNYPIEQKGSFECSDEYFNKMYEVSINTMLCCTHETFYDCPYYEQQQYDMDSAIESAVLQKMTDDDRIIRKAIEEFAVSQLPNGLLRANYPSVLTQVIPGFSFFWIFMLHDYLEYSADIVFARKFLNNVDNILQYFYENLSEDGLISKSRYWDFVDWVPGWYIGTLNINAGKPITVYNMYFAYALLCAADIAEKSGRPFLGAEYREKYAKLAEAIKKHCFDAQKGLYRDSSDKDEYSMHTVMWSVISELEKGQDAVEIMEKIHSSELRKSSFSMNYYFFRALEKCGMEKRIFDNLDGWKKMLDMHCTTWCENPDNPRSECHGWSSAPLNELASNILGVKTGFEKVIVIKPVTAHLTYAKGVVSTRFGGVEVSWENTDGFKLNVKAPLNVDKKVILPDGTVKEYGKDVSLIEL
ncbi:MAG: hypothetical protein E7588_04265 [Ruminococcaceae bacterium]|nr:hypothetical protein [Oscillospiraceae bacterium]